MLPLLAALWLLPKHNFYGEWPASGEVDIMESRGNDDLRNAQGETRSNDYVGQTMHWGPFFEKNKYALTDTQR